MKMVLDQLGVEDGRVRLEWISSAEGTKFAKVIAEFTEELRQLGPFKSEPKAAAGGRG
jgi:coenzyme F420-reducing hydrogenase delta subunit